MSPQPDRDPAQAARRLQLLDDAYSTTIMFRGDWEPYGLRLMCDYCGHEIGRVMHGDTLGGLFNDLRDHECEGRK